MTTKNELKQLKEEKQKGKNEARSQIYQIKNQKLKRDFAEVKGKRKRKKLISKSNS